MSGEDLTKITGSWGAEGGTWAVLVHGGAGEVAAPHLALHVNGCRAAAVAGSEVLRGGGSALDAVERAVLVLEDDPCFNAGTGACLNAEALLELDAAIMEGSGLRAGGVCALPPFAHPIAIARAALDDGRHVLYAAEGARQFAVDHGFTPASADAMTTPFARERWALARSQAGSNNGEGIEVRAGSTAGTVGAVARDARGTVAAATSTGGKVNKHVGRVGDSPIPGAGTYADNEAGACSATGDGEAALRVCLARSAIELLRTRARPEQAARAAIRMMGSRVGGSGGVILVDAFGRLGLAYNTKTMVWAAAGEHIANQPAGT
ncbi:MAG TPA: isoaspartyl peptidase/L-asparaginase [Polyangiaceae bacterium]|nr:isoaspartyl peptidase/L-asparaginase [Polyangiaceae bacterium]